MKVRVTIRPDQELEVDDREYLDLKTMGLLLEDTPKGGRSTAGTNKES